MAVGSSQGAGAKLAPADQIIADFTLDDDVLVEDVAVGELKLVEVTGSGSASTPGSRATSKEGRTSKSRQ